MGPDVARRTSESNEAALTLGPVTLCRRRGEVRVGGRKVPLTPLEFDLLGYLMERPDQPVSRGALLADVWGFLSPGGTRTIEVHVMHLRRKLGVPGLILTVRGVGYQATSGT